MKNPDEIQNRLTYYRNRLDDVVEDLENSAIAVDRHILRTKREDYKARIRELEWTLSIGQKVYRLEAEGLTK